MQQLQDGTRTAVAQQRHERLSDIKLDSQLPTAHA